MSVGAVPCVSIVFIEITDSTGVSERICEEPFIRSYDWNEMESPDTLFHNDS